MTKDKRPRNTPLRQREPNNFRGQQSSLARSAWLGLPGDSAISYADQYVDDDYEDTTFEIWSVTTDPY
jgi:hypothetical protein